MGRLPHPFQVPAVAFMLLLASAISAAGAAGAAVPSSDALWQGIGETTVEGGLTPASLVRMDKGVLETLLSGAPREGRTALKESQAILSLPMPDGSLSRFRIEESPVFEPELAASYPEIKSYRGQGMDIPGATVRFDWTPQGFHALILSSDLSITVHPSTGDAGGDYVSYQSADARGKFECGVIEQSVLGGGQVREMMAATGDQLRTYRVAISTTGEFTTDVGGGTVPGALAALNTILNGINAVYERDLTVHINLIAGLEPVIFTNAGTDPYTNGNTGAMIDQVVQVLAANIPAGNYDFGHVIGTNSGGLAGIGVICDNSGALGPRKGAGVSAAGLPLGSRNNISLISHEIGHQFGAPHTQNANCSRDALNAVEPGSGVTIMSYGGVCSPNNTVQIAELRFHAWSLGLMNNYIATQACQVSTPSGNGAPTVDGGPDRTIPISTPFTLTAIGGDPNPTDLPNLTYTWEQVDPGKLNGGATDFPNPPYQDQPGDPSTTTRPILRALGTSTDPARTFPQLTYILNNINDPPDQVDGLFTAEELPRVARTLNFRVTVRDNRAGAGGTASDLVTLTVNGASGPFQVTVPNGGESWTVGSQQSVTWNVNNTNNAPVSCASVKISLSVDGGLTFPHVLAASTPNDGTETITVPAGLSTPSARVKVEAVANVFFDLSNGNFTINAGAGCPFAISVLPGVGNPGTAVTISGSGFTGVTAVKFNSNVPAVFSVANDATINATIPAGAVTGPILLSKAACPDVPTTVFTLCPNPVQVALVDDGAGETFFSAGGTPQYFVSRLTPTSYPATLSQVLIKLDSFGLPVGSALTVLAGANPGGTAVIDGTVFQTAASTSGPDGSFKTFNVAPLTISSGDFVVGFSTSAGTFPGFTDNTTNQGRSYLSGNGTSFGLVSGNLLIRANYFTACGAPSVCPSVSTLSPASGQPGSSVTIVGSGFTGVTSVKFANNVPAIFNINSNGQLTAEVPAGAVSGPITIGKTDCPSAQTASFTIGSPALQACAQPGAAIPDNAPLGVTSDQVLVDGRIITGLTVGVNIQHTWIGDLIVELRHGTTTVRLHNRTGTSNDNIVGTYGTTLTVDGPGTLADFIGQSASGTWTLFVSDSEAADTGTVVDWCLNIEGSSVAGVGPLPAGPLSFRVAPNPIVDGSTISFTMPTAGLASVRIVDLAGRLVRRLQDGWTPAGLQEVRWDGRDGRGAPVGSGIYFVTVDAVGVRARGKVAVAR